MDKKLDFKSRTQLYYQLYDILYQDISNGVYKPGEMLPTENNLIVAFGVSRVTVRKAMDLLMNDGLIEKRRGQGTFVQKSKLKTELQKKNYFAKLTEEMGYIARTKVLMNKKVIASKGVSEMLNIPENTPVVNLRRVRYANNVPVRYESAYLEYSKYGEVEKKDFTDGSLRQFLKDTYDVAWSHVDEKIYAIAADAKRARHLQVEENVPLLMGECIFFTPDGQPSEVTHVYYRGDMNYFSFFSELT